MPRLSVIIPIYNVERYLRKCLDSAMDPSVDDYEIVCVNDGSTDGSGAILEEYRAAHPELLRVITTPNGGPGAASNTGVQAARGEFILFLDSDDYLAEGALRVILARCDSAIDLCIFDMASVNEAGHEIGYLKGCQNSPDSFTLEEYPQLLFDLPSRANKIFRRALLVDNGITFPNRVWFEDYRTTPKIYPHCRRIRYLPQPLYYYLQQPASITHGTNTARNREIIDASADLIAYYTAAGVFERYRNELEYCVYYNQVLTSIDRVNLIDCRSAVQGELLDDFLRRFPDYEQNPYFRSMPRKFKLIHAFIIRRQFRALHLLLRANYIVRRKG